MKNIRNYRLHAFTLTELMIVLIIVGILLLMAIPRFMPLITKAKSTEARLSLGHIHMLEKNFFYTHSRYSDDLFELDFEQEKLVTEGGTANYLVEVVHASDENFVARATAVVDFDGDGRFNIWEIDEQKDLQEIIKD